MKKKNIIASIGIAVVMLSIMVKPSIYITSAQNGIMLFALSVLPALFPFFFFSKLLSLFQADVAIGNLLELPLRKIYNTPPPGSYIFAMSLMCGYPIGARLISDYYKDGLLDSNESLSLSALASTTGPLFVLGTIGTIILSNSTAAIIILTSHYLSALLNGLIYRNPVKPTNLPRTRVASSTLYDSIYSAVISILIVGGYIIVFNIICDFVLNLGIVSLINKVIPLNKTILEGGIMSLIEVTRGSMIIGKSNIDLVQKTALIAGAVTFGGLSVIIQSTTFLEVTGVKIYKFILIKLTQSIIAYTAALILAMIIM